MSVFHRNRGLIFALRTAKVRSFICRNLFSFGYVVQIESRVVVLVVPGLHGPLQKPYFYQHGSRCSNRQILRNDARCWAMRLCAVRKCSVGLFRQLCSSRLEESRGCCFVAGDLRDLRHRFLPCCCISSVMRIRWRLRVFRISPTAGAGYRRCLAEPRLREGDYERPIFACRDAVPRIAQTADPMVM
jgi:hypothetical protein